MFIFTSILLKNSSCHFHRPRFFRSESGCKDKAFLSFLPNLFRSFFKLFSRGPVQDRSRRKRSSSTPLERRLHLNSTPSFILPLSRFSGCKDKAMIPPFPNFFTIIFHLFFKPPTNTVTGKTLGRKIFTGKTGKTTGKREGKAARPGKGTTLSPGKHLSGTPVNVFETSLIRE